MDIKYISVKDAEARYGVGQTKIYELFKNPECPSIRKFGRKTLIPVEAFDKFFDSQLTTL